MTFTNPSSLYPRSLSCAVFVGKQCVGMGIVDRTVCSEETSGNYTIYWILQQHHPPHSSPTNTSIHRITMITHTDRPLVPKREKNHAVCATGRTNQLTACSAVLSMNPPVQYYRSSSQKPKLLRAASARGTLVVLHPSRERWLLRDWLQRLVFSLIPLRTDVLQHCDLGFAGGIRTIVFFPLIPELWTVRKLHR